MSTATSLRNIFTLGVALFVLVGFHYMQAWTAPSGTPPNDNVAAPINVGNIYQFKSADLGAQRMRAGAYCDAKGENCIRLGTRCSEGQVLVADSTGDWVCGDVSVSTPSRTIVFNRSDIYQLVYSLATNPGYAGGAWSIKSDAQSQDEACNLLGEAIGGSGSYISHTVGSYNSPSNNGIATYNGSSWTVSSASLYNSFINTINCAITGIPASGFEWKTSSWGSCQLVPVNCDSAIEENTLTARNRTVYCKLVGQNTGVPDTYCSSITKPATVENCRGTNKCAAKPDR